MNKVSFKIVNNLLGDRVALPEYATQKSAGMDLRACIDAPCLLSCHETKLLPTGLAININDANVCAVLAPRSGLATKHGIVLANTVGIIDADYQGEIMIALKNTGSREFVIQPGDRICQLIFMPILTPVLEQVDDFTEITDRGDGGFGSTGVA